MAKLRERTRYRCSMFTSRWHFKNSGTECQTRKAEGNTIVEMAKREQMRFRPTDRVKEYLKDCSAKDGMSANALVNVLLQKMRDSQIKSITELMRRDRDKQNKRSLS